MDSEFCTESNFECALKPPHQQHLGLKRGLSKAGAFHPYLASLALTPLEMEIKKLQDLLTWQARERAGARNKETKRAAEEHTRTPRRLELRKHCP